VRECACGNRDVPMVLDGGRHLLRATVPRSALSSEAQRRATRQATRMWASRDMSVGVTAAYMDVGEDFAYWAIGVLDETAEKLQHLTTSLTGDEAHRELATLAAKLALSKASDDANAKETLELVMEMVNATETVHSGRSLSLTPCDKAAWALGSASDRPVTLVGDAMHAVTPSFGQGACLAMEDAFALARKVGAQTDLDSRMVAEALRAYEAERLPRTFQAQIGSYSQGMKTYGKDGSEFDTAALNFESEGGIVNWLQNWNGETVLPQPL